MVMEFLELVFEFVVHVLVIFVVGAEGGSSQEQGGGDHKEASLQKPGEES